MYDLTTIAQRPATPTPGQASQQPPRTAASLVAMMERIAEAIEAETAGIRGGGDFDIKASNARKSRHLYELSKAMKVMGGDGGHLAAHADAIRDLREKLAANERAIRAHMSAVSEIADLIQNAIQHAEADGTYSARGYASASAG